jgi:hypothetical protein
VLPLIQDGKLQHAARRSVEVSRRQLELDRRFWGDAVFRLLPEALLDSALVPVDGFLSMSIAPALTVVARLSEGCRERCLRYLEAQTRTIDTALGRLPAHAAQAHRQLSGFRENATTLHRVLLAPHVATFARSPREARSIERWLDTGLFEEAPVEADSRPQPEP